MRSILQHEKQLSDIAVMKKSQVVAIIGGNGFVGKYVVKAFAQAGYLIKVIARHTHNVPKTLGDVGQIQCCNIDAANTEALAKALQGVDYVINLIGIMNPSGAQNFDKCHKRIPMNIAMLANDIGVKKLIHLSALSVDSVVGSDYAASKYAAEKIISDTFVESFIIRSSVVFGPHDKFMNQLAFLVKYLPMIPMLKKGATKLQPIYAGDLAEAMVQIISNTSVKPGVLQFGGAEVKTIANLLHDIGILIGKKVFIIDLPHCLAKLPGIIWPNNPVLSKEEYKLLQYDNMIMGENHLLRFVEKPTTLSKIVPTYIA